MKVELDEVLKLFRVYRHDLMNQLQLVDGYASMDQHDTSREKLQVLINQLKNERKLQTIQAPQFIYWIINLKLHERAFNINWEVEDAHPSIQEIDHLLVQDGKLLIAHLKEQASDDAQIHMFIQIIFNNEWHIKYHIKGIDLPVEPTFNGFGSLNVLTQDDTTSFVLTYK